MPQNSTQNKTGVNITHKITKFYDIDSPCTLYIVHDISVSNIDPNKCLYIFLMLFLNEKKVQNVEGC